MRLAIPAFARPGKTAVALGIALVAGIFAALAANRFLAGRIEEIEARKRGATVEVVVARRHLGKGHVLGADSVALRAVPREYAHSNALTQDSFAGAAGRSLAYDMEAGEMLLASLLQPVRPPTFSGRVEAGRRAMTVAVDEINSISGLLEPGDTIDLLLALERKGKKITLPLLLGVQVMATGQRLVDLAALVADADTAAEVPVLYGGSGGKLSPDGLRLDAYKPASAAHGLTPAATPAAASAPALPARRLAGDGGLAADAAETPVLNGGAVRDGARR
jgi:Flp pilus assembly protein CpaB